MKRNYAVEVNSSVAKFYKTIGFIIIILTVVILVVKSIFGYKNLKYVGDYELNCEYIEKIQPVLGVFNKSKDGNELYFVHFTNQKENLDFEVGGEEWKDYCNYFTKAGNGNKYSVFKKSDSYFVAYEPDCSVFKADWEYRKIEKPVGWYVVYIFGVVLGFSVIMVGKKADKTAKRQTAYIKYQDIKQAEAFDKAERYNGELSPGEMNIAIDRTISAEKKKKKKNKWDTFE